MSNKKSNKKVVDMLDDNLISKEEPKANVEPSGKEISLKEFNENAPYAFNKKNYKLLLIGLGINILGYILMIGGGAEDPNTFDGEELFSHMRITISPMLIVIGYAVILYAIMKRPKSSQQ